MATESKKCVVGQIWESGMPSQFRVKAWVNDPVNNGVTTWWIHQVIGGEVSLVKDYPPSGGKAKAPAPKAPSEGLDAEALRAWAKMVQGQLTSLWARVQALEAQVASLDATQPKAEAGDDCPFEPDPEEDHTT